MHAGHIERTMSDGNKEASDDRTRNEHGQYIETVTPDRVLNVFDHVDGPTITSTDVADVLDCSTEAARRKLAELAERGELASRSVGRTIIWWRTMSRERPTPDPDRDRDYLKSFGKYGGSNMAESVAAVSDRLDRDLRGRRYQGQDEK